jgi:oligopeptide/dipeptide ABC transporter ATP-binding protein
MPLIDIVDLATVFRTDEGIVRAVDGVSFSIEREKVLGVVGESGCGKSVTALSILGLIPKRVGRIDSGRILYDNDGELIDLAKLDPAGGAIRSIRGNRIAMIFQEPMTSLNPVFTVGRQVSEAVVLHQKITPKEAHEKAVEALKEVGIPSPEKRYDDYPHQMSGGMRQRAMIAMALSCRPSLLIADEPTTALDVTIQAQVMDLMNDLRRRYKMAIMFITHDLGVIAQMADEVAVMYLGKIVEKAPVMEIFDNPLHPYTQGLLKSIPSLTMSKKDRLVPIKGVVPSAGQIPRGCGFMPRCPHAMNICGEQAPLLAESAPRHSVACRLYESR